MTGEEGNRAQVVEFVQLRGAFEVVVQAGTSHLGVLGAAGEQLDGDESVAAEEQSPSTQPCATS